MRKHWQHAQLLILSKKLVFVKLSSEGGTLSSAKQEYGEVRNVVFKYIVHAEDGTQKTATLSVPILTIVPIPYIRIDDMSIDFTANITEKEEKKQTSQTNFSSETGLKAMFWAPVRVGFKAKVAKTTNSTRSGRYSTEYKMNIHLNAVQDDIPAGLAKVLTRIIHAKA